jgi:hypothetical protein
MFFLGDAGTELSFVIPTPILGLLAFGEIPSSGGSRLTARVKWGQVESEVSAIALKLGNLVNLGYV